MAGQPGATRTAFEQMARTITVLGADDFLSGFRENSHLPPDVRARNAAFARFLEEKRPPAASLLPLLRHPDAKVRTLALVALYDLEDPSLLPRVLPLVDDGAATFPAAERHAMAYVPGVSAGPARTRPQTVGEIATAILNVYLQSGGYNYGPRGQNEEPGFEQYWKERGARASCAGWWAVRLARAGHSTTPTPKDRYGAIRTLRSRMDALREPDRTFTLLMLHGEPGADVLISDADLVAALAALGPKPILDLLQRRIATDDPDLQPSPRNRNSRSGAMRTFVLQHAGALLRPGDAKALLDQETWERDFQQHHVTDPLIGPWWAIGAAQLDRSAAPAILRDAHGRFQGRFDGEAQLELALALWTLGGDEQAGTVADWVYRELDRHMGMEAHFVARLLETGGRARGLVLARALAADRRFDDLNWKSLEALVRAINSWKARPIVLQEELEAAWSPLGVDFFMQDRAASLEKYPRAVGALLQRLAEWRARVRTILRE